MKNVTFSLLTLLVYLQTIKGRKLSTQTSLVEFCDTEGLLISKDIALTESGQSSSKTVSLSPKTFAAVCRLRVSSPKNHIVNLQFVESNMIPTALIFNNTEPHPPCTMAIYLPDDYTRPFWEGDPCSHEPLPDVDLLTSDFEVVWAPPPNPNHTKGRQIVITAVGKDGVCKEPGKHTCMRIGRQPVFCISEKLLCDGIHHCPKSSTKSDESEDLCNQSFHRSSTTLAKFAQKLADDVLRRFKSYSEDDYNYKHGWSNPKYDPISSPDFKKSNSNWKDWQLLQKKQPTPGTTTKTPTPEVKPKQADSVSAMLSKYGPWGYLMMGLLICGTVLMFCGLWECCFRKPKNQIEQTNTSQPTTVLIINQGEEGQIVAPPNYDDLDEPPSYNTLFPQLKTDAPLPSVTCCNLHSASMNTDTNTGSTTSFYSALTYVGDNSNSLNCSNPITHIVQINRNSEINDSSTSVVRVGSEESISTITSTLSEPSYATTNDHLEGT